MSEKSYRLLTLGTIFLPYPMLFAFKDFALLPLVLIALLPAFILARVTMKKSGAELNDGLKFSGIHLVVFSILLCGVFLYGHQV